MHPLEHFFGGNFLCLLGGKRALGVHKSPWHMHVPRVANVASYSPVVPLFACRCVATFELNYSLKNHRSRSQSVTPYCGVKTKQ